MTSLISMQGIRKIYGNGVLANDQVDFSLNEGEIHALAGENGAGKSTLMKILYGMERPDAGSILLRGESIHLRSPSDALHYGIGMVHQHFMLIEELSVLDNLFLGFEVSNHGVLNRQEMRKKAHEIMDQYEMQVDLETRCKDLSVSAKQKVEIIKVLLRNVSILILDEPTAVLTPQECVELGVQLRLLRSHCSMIIITHKLEEIKAWCDRVTILQHGKSQGTYATSDVSKEEISKKMVGYTLPKIIKNAVEVGKPLLQVNQLTYHKSHKKASLFDVSFMIRQGEIVCLAGVEGNGQEELVKILSGAKSRYEGSILFQGIQLEDQSIASMRKKGLSHIPSDRMTVGTNPKGSVFENLMVLQIDQESSKLGIFPLRKLKNQADEWIKKYQINTPDHRQPMSSLSGGNMQKVVVARELEQHPTLLLANQPTRGVDVGAMDFIHQQLLSLRSEGAGVLLISSDWNEVFTLADRILVIYDGKITASIDDPTSIDEYQLGRYMLGVTEGGEQHA